MEVEGNTERDCTAGEGDGSRPGQETGAGVQAGRGVPGHHPLPRQEQEQQVQQPPRQHRHQPGHGQRVQPQHGQGEREIPLDMMIKVCYSSKQKVVLPFIEFLIICNLNIKSKLHTEIDEIR